MSVPEKYEYCKPEDWDEMAKSCPDADEFLKGRSMYRQYLELRLVLYATAGEQRELVEHKLAELEAEIVSWPYRKPRPPMPGVTVDDISEVTAKYFQEKLAVFNRSDEASFFDALPHDAQLGILESAYQSMKTEVSENPDETVQPVFRALEAYMNSTTETPHCFYLDGIPSVTYPDINSAIEGANDFMDMHMNVNTVIVFDLFKKAPAALAYRVDDGYCVALLKEQE